LIVAYYSRLLSYIVVFSKYFLHSEIFLPHLRKPFFGGEEGTFLVFECFAERFSYTYWQSSITKVFHLTMLSLAGLPFGHFENVYHKSIFMAIFPMVKKIVAFLEKK